MYKENSGDREEINSSFTTSFHMKEISGMYLNIFDVFQGARTSLVRSNVPKPYNKTSNNG
jgi:hypothetical protein